MTGWIQGIVFAAIAAGLLYWLSPDGAMEKTVRAAVAVFMLTVMLAPLTRLGTVLRGSADTQEDSVEEDTHLTDLTQELREELTAAVEARVTQLLTRAGAQVERVDVVLETDGDGVLTLQRLHITVVPGSNTAQLERLLLEQTGWTAQITS